MSARVFVGDCLNALSSLPDASVDLVLTSPPLRNLRSYLPADDPCKAFELGASTTPGAYIDSLLGVVEECRRLLAPHGSLCIEIGDSYARPGGGGGNYLEGGPREGQANFAGPGAAASESNAAHWRHKNARSAGLASTDGRRQTPCWPLDKSLWVVPELFRIALVYGRNPLTGRQTPRWRARNVVRWCRLNPAVGRLADKMRPATTDIIVACTNRRRYFDLDGVSHPHKDPTAAGRPHPRSASRSSYPGGGGDVDTAEPDRAYNGHRGRVSGAPPLDHWWFDDEDRFAQDAWLIATEPYAGSHYAAWPSELLVRPVIAMCPQRVCTDCGIASTRIVDDQPSPFTELAGARERRSGDRNGVAAVGVTHGSVSRGSSSVGWSDCGHELLASRRGPRPVLRERYHLGGCHRARP